MSLFEAKVDYSEYEIFRRSTQDKIIELDNLFKSKIQELEQEIRHKATDSEQQAREAANNAIAIEGSIRSVETRVEEILQTLEEVRGKVSDDSTKISELREKLSEDNVEILSAIETSKSAYSDFLENKESVDQAISQLYAHIEEIKKTLSGSEILSEQIDNVSQISAKATDSLKDITNLLDGALKRKSRIDELHKEIMGYEIKSDDGQTQTIEGLRDELSNAYDNIKQKIEDIEDTVEGVVKEVSDKYSSDLGDQKTQFEQLISDSKDRVTSVDDELKALLPGGLAAGLSAAYEAKKDEEIQAQGSYSIQFGRAIIALVLISLIPFTVDAYLLIWENKDIVEVIKDTPNLILSILPLYFPVLWYAFSTNKKLNLSKRLIEEYTHKAVLGRTFSGLSNQIINLPHENAVKEDLRNRLLFNLLQVSSENPGKLITDYNKSDHPFMEALENSAKLSASIDILSKLPGFSAMAEKLSRKTRDIADTQTQKVVEGLATQDVLENKDDPKPDEKSS